jgi:2-polyprenyl-3-methyl-5-hydroxy-6-metoxy-1,4-benzoquinol methylase
LQSRSKHSLATAIAVFDQVAEKFTREIDEAIEGNSYTRGELFLRLVQATTQPGQLVLDYGCGPGRISLLIARAGFRVRGVDISEGMIAQARALDREGLDLEFETIVEPHPGPDSIDTIVCSSVIEYVVDPGELVRRFRTALRSPGALIISYANRSSLWRKHWMKPASSNPMVADQHDHHVWDGRRFRDLLTQNGFRVTKGPIFFESPLDRWPLFRRMPLAGALGVIVARPEAK